MNNKHKNEKIICNLSKECIDSNSTQLFVAVLIFLPQMELCCMCQVFRKCGYKQNLLYTISVF